MKKIISILVAVLMVLSLVPMGVFAVEINGYDLTITATDGKTELVNRTDYKFSSGRLTVYTTTPVTIAMREGVQSTSNLITIDVDEGEANVTLNGVSIVSETDDPLTVKGGADVILSLTGTNSLSTSDKSEYGIYKSSTGDLTITSSSNGSLVVRQTNSSSGYSNIYNPKESVLKIGGNVSVDLYNAGDHGIEASKGHLVITDDAKVTAKVADSAIYIEKCGLEISGNADVQISDSEEGIYNKSSLENASVTIKGNAKLSISDSNTSTGDGISVSYLPVIVTELAKVTMNNVGTGIYMGSSASNSNIVISEAAQVTMNVNTHGIQSNSKTGGIEISGTPTVNITSGEYGLYGKGISINGGIINLTSTKMDGSSYSLQGGSTSDVTIGGNAIVTVNSATKAGCISATGVLTIKDSAVVTAYSSNEKGCALHGGSEVYIEDQAEVTATAVNRAFFTVYGSDSEYQVTPESGYAYEVKIGEDSQNTELLTYYASSGLQLCSGKYFHAKSKSVYAIPTITVDYLNGTLVGFEAVGNYTINGEDVILNGTTFVINDSWYGTDVVIVRKGDDNAAASAAQTLTLASKPAAVSDAVTKIDETIEGKGDGIISGITAEMEYKINDGEWIAGDGEDLTDLAAGTSVTVRIKATDNAPYGEETSYIVSTGGKLTVMVPSGEGYIVSYEDSVLVSYNGTFRFKVTLLDGYEAAKDFAVTVNGNALMPDQDGVYTISEIVADQVILVNGVKKTSIPVVFIPRLENFATTTGQFDEQAYYCRAAREGDVVLLKVSTSELGDRYGLNYKNVKVVYEVEGAVQITKNYDYNGNPIYKDGIATQFMLSKGMNKMVAKVYYNGLYVGAFEPFFTYIA